MCVCVCVFVKQRNASSVFVLYRACQSTTCSLLKIDKLGRRDGGRRCEEGWQGKSRHWRKKVGHQEKEIKSEQSQNEREAEIKGWEDVRFTSFSTWTPCLPPSCPSSVYLQHMLSLFVPFTFLLSCAGCSRQLAALGQGQGMKTPPLPSNEAGICVSFSLDPSLTTKW